MNRITVLQHNINSWHPKRFQLTNTYNDISPDIILLNDTNTTDSYIIKIFNYKVYSSNKTSQRHRGTTIAIKNSILHKITDDFETDLIAITIESSTGPITIATDYIPPASPFLNTIDYLRLLHLNHPVYILGDLNAYHYSLGHTNSNPVGRMLNTLIAMDKLNHIGSYFPTFL